MRRIAGLLGCMAAVLALAGCTPNGKAVGDTQEEEPEVAYDGLDRGDATLALVGSTTAAADTLVADALQNSGLNTAYVSVQGNDDAAATRQDGVRDMVARAVDLILVSDLDTKGEGNEGWDAALLDARRAGIPVALVNPLDPPDDDTLYAAIFVINDRAADAAPIDDAAMRVVDDRPHDKTMMVTTLVD